MKTIEYRTVDKSTWGDGPWQIEPDKKQWLDQATGLPCLIVRGPSGALCGYVGVPKGHPLHGLDNSHEKLDDLDVHGGLTFSSHGAPAPTEERWRRFRDQVLAGADEAKRFPHGDAARRLRDRAKELESFDAYARWVSAAAICHAVDENEPDDVWWLGFDCAHLGDLSPGFNALRANDETYRDFFYVTRQVERLAQQLNAVTATAAAEQEP